MPEPQPEQIRPFVDLDQILTPPDVSNLTVATVKYETPSTRQARETREAANDAYERLIGLLKLSVAGILLLGFFSLGVYLFAFKPTASEAQKLYASTVLTAIASGSAGYAFGKKDVKSEKE